MALSAEERKELLLSIEENQLVDALFDHPGMKILLDKCEDLIAEYDRLDGIKDLNDLKFKQGQIDILKWLLSYQTAVRQALEQLVEQAEREVQIAKAIRAAGVFND